jgi:hypothetical protein
VAGQTCDPLSASCQAMTRSCRAACAAATLTEGESYWVTIELKNDDDSTPANPSAFHDSQLEVACATFDTVAPASPGVPATINWCSPGTTPTGGMTIASLGDGQYNVTFTVHWLLAAPAYHFSHDARCGEWFFDACQWRSYFAETAQQTFLNTSSIAVFNGTPNAPLPAAFYLPTNATAYQALVGYYNGIAINNSGLPLELRPGSTIGRDTHYLPRAQTYRWAAGGLAVAPK